MIKPHNEDPTGKKEQVREMFDSIARRYDLLNHLLSMNIDRRWRSRVVKMLRRQAPDSVLDVATGTGDLAFLLCRMLKPARVVGIDLSANMLAEARAKAAKKGLSGVVGFSVADCLALPFADGEFDAATVAYGVRNFEHLEQGYAEMWRVLRPGGVLCVIELSTPRNPLAAAFYRFYTRRVIPFAGRRISKDPRAYTYLPESIAAAPQGKDMTAIMERVGFCNCRFRRLTFGVCTIYLGEKPM